MSSSILNTEGVWALASTLGNRSTTVDTRSLSITPIGNGSSEINSTTKSALLLYENATGIASALLKRISPQFNQYSTYDDVQWIDITDQESQSLPEEFRNVPDGLDGHFGKALYESGTNTTFGTPFICTKTNVSESMQNSKGAMGAWFYSPSSASFEFVLYNINPSGPGNFSFGMHCASPHTD